MKQLRQLVGAVLVLAVAFLMPAPLLACATMENCCPMMSQSGDMADMDMGAEDSASGMQCPDALAVAGGCMTSRCCQEMGEAPAAAPTQLAPEQRLTPVAQPATLFAVIAPATSRRDGAAELGSYAKPVFELKADLRI